MALSIDLIYDVKQSEGLRLQAYKDTTGNWTVGYGHKLAAGHDWTGYTITSDYAFALLLADLNAAVYDAAVLPEWAVLDTQPRKDALTELIFNMGTGRWKTFVETRAAMMKKDWQSVHDGLLHSLWATQVHAGRADRIANQFLTGAYSLV
jgi:lysozyme